MDLFPAETIKRYVTPLLRWYDVAKRQMPWRDDVSPYHTWVSEIMLQQTRVEAVRGYYDRFIKALPDVMALAAADMEQVLKLWEGLGYYSRVRNLKKAAEIVCSDFGGFLPKDRKALEALPGIGAYTAGAILSIAYGLPKAAVDGNVIRVFARLLDIDTVITDDAHKKQLADAIEKVMPEGRCGDFTQSLMELGALVCIPGAPRCENCPLQEYCKGLASGRAAKLPVLPPKPEKTVTHKTVCLLCSGDTVFLRKRSEKGLLAGLWEPWQCDGTLSAEQVLQKLSEQHIKVESIRESVSHTHVFTHAKWVMSGFIATVTDAPGFENTNIRENDAAFAVPKAFAPFLEDFKKWKK